jgi:hypothetical protein
VKKEIWVQLIVTTVGFLIGSLWPGMVWGELGMVTGGAPFPKEWFWIITGWSSIIPIATSLMIAVIPMSSRHKTGSIAALLTPVILFSLYQLSRTGFK